MSRAHGLNVPLTCAICGKSFASVGGMPAELIRPSVQLLIARDHPDFGPGHFICLNDLNRYRHACVEASLRSERGAVSGIDQEIQQIQMELMEELMVRLPERRA